ncbi:MAG: sulfatase, partial [Planctomyces sp.]|nr:sulfatase [Planctomyces sp.]
DQINHDPAHTLFNTGSAQAGRPSMGSWLLYGLGQECNDLPGYVVLTSVGKGGQAQPIAARQWHSGFLPSRYQGVQFHATGAPVLYLNRPDGVSMSQQQRLVENVNKLNRGFDDVVADPEIATRIGQYEMAFRMQSSVPELMDLSGETAETMEAYGSQGGDGTYASNCLLARRLLERGVRCVQLYHRAWDHHGGIKRSMEITAKEVDQATAALIRDLKQRGLFDDTLIIWGGEFGRTPMAQGSGRDHHIKGFSMLLSGGAVQGGISYGSTDEFGYAAQENPVHVRDLHATLLHLFGINHKKFSYRFQGLDFRLTGVEEAHVVHDILA